MHLKINELSTCAQQCSPNLNIIKSFNEHIFNVEKIFLFNVFALIIQKRAMYGNYCYFIAYYIYVQQFSNLF